MGRGQGRSRLAARFADLVPRYNLLTRRVALNDVRLSAPGHGDEPFFAARRVSAALPWAVFLGTVRLSSLEVDDGVVRLVRERGVLVNLPPSSGLPPPAVPRRLDLRGLRLRGLDVEYVDRTGDIDVGVAGLQTTLAERDVPGFVGAGGTITAEHITARVGDKSTTSGAVAGQLAFDGSDAVFDTLTVPFPEGTVVADGPIHRVLDDTSFGLALKGTLDLARLVEWAPPPTTVSGGGTFNGTMQGSSAPTKCALPSPRRACGSAAPSRCRSTPICRSPRRGRWSSVSASSRPARGAPPNGQGPSTGRRPTPSVPRAPSS